jgi:PTS system N-acetylglucosamine-specific IIC component
MKFFQRLGRSIMLPVAVLPVAAILSGISYWISSAAGANTVSRSSALAGALLDNMPLLFAVGVSIGMANKTDGTSALAGLVSWLTITTLLAPRRSKAAGHRGSREREPRVRQGPERLRRHRRGPHRRVVLQPVQGHEAPRRLSFFSGKRSVAIVTAGLSLVVAVVLMFVWPVVYGGLVFRRVDLHDGPVGAGIYGFLNRLLIPTGLHHALNSVFWFDVAGINDLVELPQRRQRNLRRHGPVHGRVLPVMMFGLPGAALAMYLTADSRRKKITYGIMLSGAVSSFFVGVTEPLEFSFMFVAPWLYLIHAVFTGISVMITAMLPTRLGFGFSAASSTWCCSGRTRWPEPVDPSPHGRRLVLHLLLHVLLRDQALQAEDAGPWRRDRHAGRRQRRDEPFRVPRHGGEVHRGSRRQGQHHRRRQLRDASADGDRRHREGRRARPQARGAAGTIKPAATPCRWSTA